MDPRFLLCIVCALESTVTKVFLVTETNGATPDLDVPRQVHGFLENTTRPSLIKRAFADL